MVAGPSDVFVSSAAVCHCWAKVIVRLVHLPALAAHRSCQIPWSWLYSSTVQAKVSPVWGFTANTPRKIGQAGDPVVPPELVGQSPALVISPAPGRFVLRSQVMPSVDW